MDLLPHRPLEGREHQVLLLRSREKDAERGFRIDEAIQDQGAGQAEAPHQRRVERAVFETDRQRVVGDLTLPHAGYQSRFSDSLNRGEFEFVPLTNVEIISLDTGNVTEVPFLVLSKRHVRIAYPADG
jgi:hypothetical protein